MTAVQLLWVNLIMDTFAALALGMFSQLFDNTNSISNRSTFAASPQSPPRTEICSTHSFDHVEDDNRAKHLAVGCHVRVELCWKISFEIHH